MPTVSPFVIDRKECDEAGHCEPGSSELPLERNGLVRSGARDDGDELGAEASLPSL